MKPSFYIKSNTDTAAAHLFVFISEYSVSMAVLNHDHVFTDIAVYNFELPLTDKSSAVKKIFEDENISLNTYRRTDIIWCTAQSIITPQSFFTKEGSAAMLNLLFGDAGTYVIKHELMLKQHAYNVYRITAETEKLVSVKFPIGVQWHQSSLMVNFSAGKTDFLYCNFNPGSITVMLRSNKQLQAIQTFEYSTPEDAAYHLLNICQRFNVAASATILTVSGMIDVSSNLYKELYKYFSGIEFLELPDAFNYSDEISNHPAHYFSHLFNTAACVL